MRDFYVLVDKPTNGVLQIRVFNENKFVKNNQKRAIFTRENVRFHVVASSPKPVSVESVKRLLEVYYDMLKEWGEIES